MNMMTGFSVLPLQFASWVGFGFTFFGLLVLMYVLGRYIIEGGSVPGFPFLASMIAIFSGAQLFALGGAAVRARDNWRVSGAHALSLDGQTSICRAGGIGGRISRGRVSPMSPLEEPAYLLSWDSSFFGFRIGRVHADALDEGQVAQLDAWAQDNLVRCLYFQARSDDPTTVLVAESNQFHLVDVRITFVHQFRGQPLSPSPNANIRRVLPSEVGILREIALDSYRESRFYFDRRMARERVSALYETWIVKSCNGYADVVFVAHDSDQRPIGFVSCDLSREQKDGSVGLIGVNQDFRGQGVGTALVQQALLWCFQRGMNNVRVVTQARNVEAQRLYQRNDFVTEDVHLWYHKWYDSPGA
jgi:ribosomal protein S18 acetylase RimI-like enzyme